MPTPAVSAPFGTAASERRGLFQCEKASRAARSKHKKGRDSAPALVLIRAPQRDTLACGLLLHACAVENGKLLQISECVRSGRQRAAMAWGAARGPNGVGLGRLWT
jgi:hypothetical protein